MSNVVYRLVLALALLLPLSAQTKGKLTVAGKTVALNHAYAWMHPRAEFEGATVVLLSDVPLPPAMLRDEKAQDALAKSGKIHFVRLTFKGPPDVFMFYIGHNAAKEAPEGTVNFHRFDGKIGSDVVTGKVSSAGEQKSFEDVPYEYSCEFTVKVLPKS